jgi:hypothetical protein
LFIFEIPSDSDMQFNADWLKLVHATDENVHNKLVWYMELNNCVENTSVLYYCQYLYSVIQHE